MEQEKPKSIDLLKRKFIFIGTWIMFLEIWITFNAFNKM